MTPVALCRWIVLRDGTKVPCPAGHVLYLSPDGAVLEATDWESPPAVHAWDTIASVVLVTEAGTRADEVARAMASGSPLPEGPAKRRGRKPRGES